MQALVGLLCPGTGLCPTTMGLPLGSVLGSFRVVGSTQGNGIGIIPELLVKHCAPHPAMEQFQDCITSPLQGVQALSVLFSTWVLLIRRNMLGKSAFTKKMFPVKHPMSFLSSGSLPPPLLNLQSQPVGAVAAGIET